MSEDTQEQGDGALLNGQVESVFKHLNVWTFRLAKLELQRM